MAADILTGMGVEYEISCYAGARELAGAMAHPQREIHLLLLDIIMEAEDAGMKLAAWLRGRGNPVGIVLISRSADFALSGYDVQAIKYILKPVDRRELEAAIRFDYENHHRRRFLVAKSASWQGVPLSEIVYLETHGKKMAVQGLHGVSYYPGRISDVLGELPPDSFCRCHQSFILNLDNMDRIVRYTAFARDGREVPVSKRFYKGVLEAFLRNLERR